MLWFKHYTDSLDDPFIVELMDEFGHKGYTFWFGLVGIICQQVGNDLDQDFICSDIYLKRKLRISTTNVALLCDFCATKGKLIYSFTEKKYHIKVPNIARIKDNYTKDLQGSSKLLSLEKSKSKIKKKSKSKKEKSEPLITEVFVLPEWINKETWNSFVGMRKEIKKPLGDEARKRIIIKLEKFKKLGQDINEILSTSIENSWAGVFEEKGKNGRKIKKRTVDSDKKDYSEGIENLKD